MRGALIVHGSTIKSRQQTVVEIIEEELGQKTNWNYLTNYPDIKLIEVAEDKKSIGISQAKEGIKFLQEKPLAIGFKALIINPAELLTDEAQNSLLKTLEEPPVYALVILIAKTENSLLETVRSRCRRINAKESKEELKEDSSLPARAHKIVFNDFLKIDKGTRLDWAEEFAKEERETIVTILEEWVVEAREDIEKNASNIKEIQKTLKDMENTGLGVRLLLECLVLSLK